MKNIFTLLFFIQVSLNGWSQGGCNPSSATGTPNCTAAQTGFTPIHDLGTGTWVNNWNGNSMQGGLYPNGSNFIPASHKAAGITLASQLQPLDTAGNPSPTGKIVLLSIGLSNTNIEACEFDSLANIDPCKNSKVVCVNGAQGGFPAMLITSPWYQGGTPYNNYWGSSSNPVGVYGALVTASGSRPKQVQAVWFKETNPAPPSNILYTSNCTSANSNQCREEFYDSLVVQFKRALLEIVTRYPNVKVCYISSRISARYADVTSVLNPEPFAYIQGWTCKKVIEDQINGLLPYSGSGRVAPWIAWSPYLWSDGIIPQVNYPSINWTCPNEFALDGTHPSLSGARKVGNLLLCMFKTDSTCYPWFTASGNPCFTGYCSTTGTNELPNKKEIKVYPNPSVGKISVELKTVPEKIKIEVYSALGKKIYCAIKENSSEKIFTLDLNLPEGIYNLIISEEKNLYSEKVVIIK
ncbi:MAG: T9SS type A sorting domain-containing protein [Bacteroidetes bacterium]|nr:T9SS type A sorting domain-containing protein [Bacteroidota bacterium]